MGCPPPLSQPCLWPPLEWASHTATLEDILVNDHDDHDNNYNGLGLILLLTTDYTEVMGWKNLTKQWINEQIIE